MPIKKQLEKQGWKFASVSGGDHLMRILAMYEELGMETRIEEIASEDCPGCTECYLAGVETRYRVYIKAIQGDKPRGN